MDNSMDKDQTGRAAEFLLFLVVLAGVIFMVVYWQ